ncbi:MAG: chromosomal replication initiator protein DnaA [Bacteroidaceae bacterium]|nr:chromosomal replication initiator protein DnaA [Bacteroidaceae bacterium]
MTNDTQKWSTVLETIRSGMPPATYKTWFEHITYLGTDDNKVQLQVPNEFFYEYLVHNFSQILLEGVNKVFGLNNIDIKIKEEREIKPAEDKKKKGDAPAPKVPFDTHLSQTYTFDNFVKGEANKLAHSIAMTIATKPMQTAFNPFFLYGDSGVGKSHLVNAIGLKMLQKDPNKRVLYISAHDFFVQYTHAATNFEDKHAFNNFMYFYQSIDCLIVDDIHEVSGKKGTQEALFNIFNHLQRNGRQIIFTSDKAPAQLQGFEPRVSSRFVMGVTVELQRPDHQLRRNILKAKSRKNRLNLPSDVIDYIAEHVTTNVRDLEGIVNTLLLQSIVENGDITLEMTEKTVSRLVRLRTKKVTPELVVGTVCKHFKLTQREFNSPSRKASIVTARQIAMFLLQKHTDMSTPQIGLHIGRRDHTTVLHAIRQVEKKIKAQPGYKEEIQSIEQEMTK